MELLASSDQRRQFGKTAVRPPLTLKGDEVAERPPIRSFHHTAILEQRLSLSGLLRYMFWVVAKLRLTVHTRFTKTGVYQWCTLVKPCTGLHHEHLIRKP